MSASAANSRDTWLKAALPALLTGIVYIFWFMRPATQVLSTTQAEAQRLKGDVPPASQLDARLREVTELNAQRDKSAQPKLINVMFTPKAAHDRAASIQKLTEVLGQRGLVLSSSEVIDNSAEQVLPTDVDAISKKLVQEYGVAKPRLWRVKASGTYLSMTEALRDLGTIEQMIVPISVDMQAESEDEKNLIWTLTVWM